ncbi:MAG: DUF4838 domain-containing protein [bacterium]|jgi:hypothetical protein
MIRVISLLWGVVLPVLFVVAAPAEERFELFADGTTEYEIVIPENPSETLRWAARELRHWLKEVSGADFPIVEDCVNRKEKEIVLGLNRHAKEGLPEKSLQNQPEEQGFVIQSQGATVYIYGGDDLGTQYGVFDFLETYLGCRWYTPTVSVIPEKQQFSFTSLNRQDYPRLRVRNDFYYEAFEPIWAARNRINGVMSYREQPGGVEGYWGVHTFYYFLPPDEFFAEHPEYFSEIDGQRKYDHAQLCLTNPEVLQIMIERVKKFMREHPEYLIYDVSQNDWYGACQCDKCQAITEAEGSEAGPVLSFVNKVAEAVEEEFPDKYIGTLAYQYTRKPPKTLRPRDNVVVRLCSIECCFSHSFYECPQNEAFLDDLQRWAKIAPQLYIWDYVVNFRHYVLPHPNFRALQPNLQAFAQNKAIGVMEQACYNTRGGEFSELRAYLLAKLLWNPFRTDTEQWIDDFMYGYYGRSGQYVRAYFDRLHDYITPDTHMGCFASTERPYFTDEFIQKSESLFDQAEAVADNIDILHRVEMARLPVMYLKLIIRRDQAKQDGTYARFKAICEREGIERLIENRHISEFWKEMDK